MRMLFGWTAIFRGNYVRNLKHMCKAIYKGFIFLIRLTWRLVEIPIRISLWILGVDWYTLQIKIYRKIRILFT